jgi:hypothetical protein
MRGLELFSLAQECTKTVSAKYLEYATHKYLEYRMQVLSQKTSAR